MFNLQKHIESSIETKKKILNDATLLNSIHSVAIKMVEAIQNGNKILIAGNGGSAADAQHFAGELVSKFFFNIIELTTFFVSLR